MEFRDTLAKANRIYHSDDAKQARAHIRLGEAMYSDVGKKFIETYCNMLKTKESLDTFLRHNTRDEIIQVRFKLFKDEKDAYEKALDHCDTAAASFLRIYGDAIEDAHNSTSNTYLAYIIDYKTRMGAKRAEEAESTHE